MNKVIENISTSFKLKLPRKSLEANNSAHNKNGDVHLTSTENVDCALELIQNEIVDDPRNNENSEKQNDYSQNVIEAEKNSETDLENINSEQEQDINPEDQ